MGSLSVILGSLWVVVGSLWVVVGSLRVVVESLWVVPGFSNYDSDIGIHVLTSFCLRERGKQFKHQSKDLTKNSGLQLED